MKKAETSMGDSTSHSIQLNEKGTRNYEGEFIIYLKGSASLKEVPKSLRKNRNLPDFVVRVKKMIYVQNGSFQVVNRFIGFRVGRSSFSWAGKWVNRVADRNGRMLWCSNIEGIEEDIPE